MALILTMMMEICDYLPMIIPFYNLYKLSINNKVMIRQNARYCAKTLCNAYTFQFNNRSASKGYHKSYLDL